jgi:ribosome biogenesis GTPase / thiamine phosphate phosphatase
LNISSTSLNQPNFGIVYKKSTNLFTVQSGSRMVPCDLSARLRKGHDEKLKKYAGHHEPIDRVTVGDEVHFIEGPGGTGSIVEVLPRRSKLARRSAVPMPTAMPFEQVIVANVDQVVPVFSAANPKPSWNMLDRYLVTAEAAGLKAVVCITKIDLAHDQNMHLDETLEVEVDDYRRIGYPVILVSAVSGQGLDELCATLQGRKSVLLGKSGVGKTSLLNALQPGLGLRVNAVSQLTSKGKHTTTHLEMFPLELGTTYEPGGAVVDTPGVREFGLWGVDEDDLALFFPEMRPLVGQCRFGLDCRHDDEPGCALRKAVMNGSISPRRYQSYMKLKKDLEP